MDQNQLFSFSPSSKFENNIHRRTDIENDDNNDTGLPLLRVDDLDEVVQTLED